MKRLSSLGSLRNKCDKAMQIRGQRENPICFVCGKPSQVMHHFIPKSVSSRLRYEWDNLIPLCNGCHNRLHQSGDPHYEHTIIQKKGIEWYQRLRKLKEEIIKVNRSYYEQVLEKLLT